MNKTTAALKLAEEALDLAQALLEKSCHHATILNAYKETRKYREALTEQEKQPDHFAKAIAELVNCCKVLAEENEAVVLEEREACAKVCEQIDTAAFGSERPAPNDCAAAIRARGEK